jgi:anthranilate phosphoribosyltransferase
MKELIEKIARKEKIDERLSKTLMLNIVDREVPGEQIAGLLVALRVKGESPEEIAGFVEGILEKAVKPELGDLRPDIDTCGTGGDGKNTWNISTAVSLLLASDGVKVAKHGNKGISSKSGSADVLEALGIKTKLNPEEIFLYLKKFNFAFIFAPLYHPSMKRVAEIRKNLGIRTIFNLLGPLTNPCFPETQIIGVPDADILLKLSKAANILNRKILFYTSKAGFDEAIPGDTVYINSSEDPDKTIQIDTSQFKLSIPGEDELKVSSSQESAQRIFELFSSHREPDRSVIALNSAIAYLALQKVKDLKQGIERALEVLKSGKPRELIQRLRRENVNKDN